MESHRYALRPDITQEFAIKSASTNYNLQRHIKEMPEWNIIAESKATSSQNG